MSYVMCIILQILPLLASSSLLFVSRLLASCFLVSIVIGRFLNGVYNRQRKVDASAEEGARGTRCVVISITMHLK